MHRVWTAKSFFHAGYRMDSIVPPWKASMAEYGRFGDYDSDVLAPPLLHETLVKFAENYFCLPGSSELPTLAPERRSLGEDSYRY